MKRSIHLVMAGCLALVCVVQFSGCFAMIGYQIGAAADSSERLETKSAGSVEKGERLTVRMREGWAFSGRYREMVDISPAEYSEGYDKARKKSEWGFLLPGIGETVSVVDRYGGRHELTFQGFGLNGRKGNGHGPIPASEMTKAVAGHYLAVSSPGSANEARMYLTDVKRIVGDDGDVVEGKTVMEMMREREIPVRTGMTVDVGYGKRYVGLDDVAEMTVVKRNRTGNGKWVGMGIGLVLDAAAIGLAAYGISQMEWDWGSDSSSYDNSCYDGDTSNDQFCNCDSTSPGGVQSLLFLVLVFALLLRRAKAYCNGR